MTNQGSLGGIDALLGCPLLLPSSKVRSSQMLTLTFFLATRKVNFINHNKSPITNKSELPGQRDIKRT